MDNKINNELYKIRNNTEMKRASILNLLSKSKEDLNLEELYSYCAEFSKISENILTIKPITKSSSYIISLNGNKFFIRDVSHFGADNIDILVSMMLEYISYDTKILH